MSRVLCCHSVSDSVAGILLDIQKYFKLSDEDTGLLQTGNKIS